MKLKIKMPPTCKSEKLYIVDVLLSEFLGLDYTLNFEDIENVEITGDSSRKISLPDTFFTLAEEGWLSEECMPRLPLKRARSVRFLDQDDNFLKADTPIIYGDLSGNDEIVSETVDGYRLHVDIFGSCFFMMSRTEEVIVNQRDAHKRFSARESIAYKEKFIDRPIVNEYLEILWLSIKTAWPTLQRKKKSFQSMPTHDVDRPYRYLYSNFYSSVSDVSGMSPSGNRVTQVLKNTVDWFAVKRGKLDRDPFNTFDKLMDLSEKNGEQSTFYFLTSVGKSQYDGEYTINDEAIVQLLNRINRRGHLIGLHGSYNSYNNDEEIAREKYDFTTICEKNGIPLDRIRSRQHYLRWETPLTFRLLDQAGIHYDSSLGFADHAGFRCGTCYDYPAYDVVNRKKLSLREFPLILMERSVLEATYMGMGDREEALAYMKNLKSLCRKYGGNFIYLWHNNKAVKPEEYELLSALSAA